MNRDSIFLIAPSRYDSSFGKMEKRWIREILMYKSHISISIVKNFEDFENIF